MGIVSEVEKEIGSIPHIQLLHRDVRQGMREWEYVVNEMEKEVGSLPHIQLL
jgi:hypothetical protein